jgi:hypothetical protein
MRSRNAIRLCAAAAVLSVVAHAQALAGVYTVGAGGTYANIGAAGTALMTNGVAGPVTFSVISNDVGPWTLGAFPGQGPGNPVVFDGGGVTSLSNPAGGLLTLAGCSDVTFTGFTATTTVGAMVTVNAPTANCTFTNCSFSMPSVTSGTTVVFNNVGGTNITIRSCDFGGGWEAFNHGTAAGSLLIERCRMLCGGWWGARIGGPNCTFRNNFVYGNTNYGISCGISGSPLAALNLKIHNNSFYCTHNTGSQFDTLRWYCNTTSEVINNIFYDVHPAGNGSGFVMWCSGAYRPTVMNYNVYYQVSGLAFMYASANTTFAGWQALGFDLNSIVADPLYLGIGSVPPDLHLTSGSPAESIGTTIPTVVDDFDGNPRVAPYDIGAHEATAFNILTFNTTGGGVGDLVAGISNIGPTVTEGYLLISALTSNPIGSGPALGLWPDATTWSILLDPSPALPGNPLHFAVGFPGLFPSTPFIVPPGSLSFLAGTSWDVVGLMIGVGPSYAGRTNLVRVNW